MTVLLKEAFLRMGRLSDEKNEEIKKLKTFSEQKSEELRVCYVTTDFRFF